MCCQGKWKVIGGQWGRTVQKWNVKMKAQEPSDSGDQIRQDVCHYRRRKENEERREKAEQLTNVSFHGFITRKISGA